MKRFQKGFTLIELMIVGGAVLTLTTGGLLVWAIVHFVSKLW